MIAHEQFTQVKFLAAEMDAALAAGESESVLAQNQIAEREGICLFQLGTAAAERADAGQKFFGVKGLGEIIICSAVQPLYPVFHVAAGGEHQNGGGVFLLSQAAQNGETVHFGQHHIQNHHVVNIAENIIKTGFTVETHVGSVIVQNQKILKSRGKAPFVFYD